MIGFIGIGKLGSPASDFFEEAGHVVKRADVGDSIEDCVKDCEFVFVAVPTPHDPLYDGKYICSDLEPKDFSYDIVKDVIIKANEVMNKKQCLVLISTVLPGTVRREIAPLVTRTNLLYNPYLIAMGTVKADMAKPEMIMIGGDPELATALQIMYMNMPVNCNRYIKGTYEEIESTKIFYNTFITMKITMCNMIQDVAMKLGNMNVDVVTQALAESTDRIMSPKYMKAGMGDGGSCHPRDNIALRCGEAMAIGSSFHESVQKALASMESGLTGFDEVEIDGMPGEDDLVLRDGILVGQNPDAQMAIDKALTRELAIQSPDRMRVIGHAMRFGFSDDELHSITRFDPWFLARIREIIEMETVIKAEGLPRDEQGIRRVKMMGFTDGRLAI